MPSLPLVSHSSLDDPIAWRDGVPVPVRDFLVDVTKLAAVLPQGAHVFNACKDRYRFAVGFCAALTAGKVSLLPTCTPQGARELRSFAPDTFCLYDTNQCEFDLPHFRFPSLDQVIPRATQTDANAIVPRIDASQVAAYVFTSGSTGAPVPHRKTWGSLVKSVRSGLPRLGLPGASGGTLVGTVPPQHMYGFEHTVLLALIGGFAFSSRQPFYPADIRTELESVPEPRVLVTSPIHLRALLMSEDVLPRVARILSATAPLSQQLATQSEARLAAPLTEIYGSTETGKIATRRTAQAAAWQLVPDVALHMRVDANDDEADAEADAKGNGQAWAAGGHVEVPTPLADVLELLDDTHFLLHGRKADLVNIAGKRTSLACLNLQLNTIPGVEDGAFFMPDPLPSDCDAQREPIARLTAFVVAPARSSAEIQRALRERIDAVFMPRPLLFVDSLPRNETGKLPRDALAALFEQHARAARGAVGHDGKAGHIGMPMRPITFEIPLEHPALPGHFPGQPIVPGVVLLAHAISGIGKALARPLDACSLSMAKFPSPARPGEPLQLTCDTNESGAISFTVTSGSRTVATGVLSERLAA